MTEKESHIGRRIARFRKAEKLTAAQLAERSGLSLSVIQNIESGRRRDLSISQLLNIARGVGIAPMFLLFDIERPGSPVDLVDLNADLSKLSGLELELWLSAETWFRHGRGSATNDVLADLRNDLHAYLQLSRQITHAQFLAQSVRESGPDSPWYDSRDSYTDRLTEGLWQELEACDQRLRAAGISLENLPYPHVLDPDGRRNEIGPVDG